MKRIFTLSGAVFIIYSGALLFLANIDTGVIATAFLGIFLLVLGIFYDRIKTLTEKGVMRFVKAVVIMFICLECALLAFLFVYGQLDNVRYNEDAIIVLGAGVHGDRVSMPLKLRLDKALEYHEKNPDALIVVTGGQGFQESVTEAYAMEQYLLRKGVDKDKIIKEEQASSTKENMEFSKQILDARFDGGCSVAVITNDFHIYRSVLLAKAEGFNNVTHLHTALKWYNVAPCYLRESLAVIKTWILG